MRRSARSFVIATALALVAAPLAPAEPALSGEVVVEVKTLHDPLPAGSPAHPAACDSINYLKYRLAGTPEDPAAADSVLVAQAGAQGGAGSLDRLARNTLTQAAAAGRTVQFVALDRRSNCVEDNTGVFAAARAGDPKLAFDYYYGGKEVDGRRFAGFPADEELKVLADFGFRRAVLDEHKVLLHEVPDPDVRQSKVFLGGHSMGGFITAAFAAWDFDGTEAGRGYNQVAGFFALDTFISADLLGVQGNPQFAPIAGLAPGLGYDATVSALRASQLPQTLRAGNYDFPELLTLLGALGVAASSAPEAESRLRDWVPAGSTLDDYAQFVLSKEFWNYFARTPEWRDYRATNEAVLGAIVDENSEPIAPLQFSVGTFDTARVAQKHYPVLGATTQIPGAGLLTGALIGKPTRIIPTQPATLTRWRSFDEMSGAPVQRDDLGRPVTSAASEVTDLADLAEGIQRGPLNFVEQYFPNRLLFDAVFMSLGARSGDLASIRFAEEMKAKPMITLCAGESPYCEFAPSYLAPTKVTFPGYTHVDVVAAAAVQNNGKPEQVAANLAAFVAKHSD